MTNDLRKDLGNRGRAVLSGTIGSALTGTVAGTFAGGANAVFNAVTSGEDVDPVTQAFRVGGVMGAGNAAFLLGKSAYDGIANKFRRVS